MPIARTFVRIAVLTSAILLAACNSGPSTPNQATSSPPAAAASSGAVPDSASTASPGAPAAASTAGTATNSDMDSGNRPPPPVGMPAGPAPVEGTDYFAIDTPDAVTGPKVQVVEVFGYGCPHCNVLAPYLETWEKKLPNDVAFSYMPAAFGPGPAHCWDEFARGFYASQAMGVPLSKSHMAVYKAVWDQDRFNEECTNIPKIYADFGLDPKTFASTMQSFAMNARIANAHDQEIRWGVDGTPSIIVDGKYRVAAATPAAMLHTVDWLIAKQRPLHAAH